MPVRDCPCVKDCPNRSAECRLTCLAWQEYEKRRAATYAMPHPEYGVRQYEYDRLCRVLKEKFRHKRR
jgi:hypothetical protein